MSKQGGSFVYSISKNRIKNIRESTPEEIERRKRKENRFYEVDKEKDKIRKENLEKYRLERYNKQVRQADKTHGKTKIEFPKNKFGVIEAILNEKVTAKLVVDTGASLVVISKKIAKDLEILENKKVEAITVILTDGSKSKAIPLILNSLEVGGIKVENVKAAISENPPGPDIDGLLGMSFLSNFHVKLAPKDNSLTLEKF